MAELGGKADFRQPATATDSQTVLIAFARSIKWMDDHPGCGVAAWLMSGIVAEDDYAKDGLNHLVEAAKAAQHDLE